MWTLRPTLLFYDSIALPPIDDGSLLHTPPGFTHGLVFGMSVRGVCSSGPLTISPPTRALSLSLVDGDGTLMPEVVASDAAEHLATAGVVVSLSDVIDADWTVWMLCCVVLCASGSLKSFCACVAHEQFIHWISSLF